MGLGSYRRGNRRKQVQDGRDCVLKEDRAVGKGWLWSGVAVRQGSREGSTSYRPSSTGRDTGRMEKARVRGEAGTLWTSDGD